MTNRSLIVGAMLLAGVPQLGAAEGGVIPQASAWAEARYERPIGTATSTTDGEINYYGLPSAAFVDETLVGSSPSRAVALATSQLGLIRTSVSANLHTTGAADDLFIVSANTEAQWIDTLKLHSPNPNRVNYVGTFTFSVDGTIESPSSRNLAMALLRYEFNIYDQNGDLIESDTSRGAWGKYSTGYEYTEGIWGSTISLPFVLPSYVDGDSFTYRLALMAGAVANSTSPGDAEDVSARGDFSHTILYQSLDFTENGAPIDATVTSALGFNYAESFSVPEIDPTALAPILAGLAAFAGLLERRLSRPSESRR